MLRSIGCFYPGECAPGVGELTLGPAGAGDGGDDVAACNEFGGQV